MTSPRSPMPAGLKLTGSEPLGITGWSQGNPDVFSSQSGDANSYIVANFENTADTGTISDWLLLPTRTLQDGDLLTFYTRTTSGLYPDRLQVRMSLNGGSTSVGTTATSVGDFTTLLLDINPTYSKSDYPTTFTQFTVTLSGIGSPTLGRLSLRYFVEDGGRTGNNSDYIGVDTLSYLPVSCPSDLIFEDGFEAGEDVLGRDP
jgi:hypothetical protein